MKTQYKAGFKFILFILFFINSSLKSQQLALPNQVITSVGSHQITVKDFVTRCSDYIFSTGIKDNIVLRKSIMNNMINEILLYYYDDNKKIFNDPEYQKELKWADKQTILAYLEDQEIYAKITVTDAEIREAYYRSNEKLSARHLFAQTEEEANSLYQLLQTGADFKVLAKQVFTDSTLQNNGGYLGYFSWGDMDPAFEDAAYSLKIGEISKPVKTKNGYSIIKLEDRVPHPLLTEDEFIRKKHHMEGVVRLRKKKPAEEDYINTHFTPDKLLFNEKLLGKILDNLPYSSAESAEIRKPFSSSSICVKYPGRSYKQNEIERRLNEIPTFHREKIVSIDNLKSAIAGIVLQDILYKIAVEKGYDVNPAVRNIIPKYHNMIYLAYKRKEISDAVTLPDSTIKKFYDDNSIYFTASDEMNVQEIILKDKSLAENIINDLKNNSDFGSLAEKYSLREWSAKNKGIMGFAELSKYGILKDTLWKSEINKVIGPIKIQEMYGIFKVIGKKNGQLKNFDQVKKIAENLAKKEKSSLLVDEYVNRIKSKVKISIDEKLLGSAIMNN
ncbi:MAG: peptidylprolyl isomerase [Ignavibacteriales bacterium]|nr:peptidylprolyl isomerase [Ignavibacteriales bacterium]